MGETACQLLIDQIKGDKTIKQVTIPTHLQIRESSIKYDKKNKTRHDLYLKRKSYLTFYKQSNNFFLNNNIFFNLLTAPTSSEYYLHQAVEYQNQS